MRLVDAEGLGRSEEKSTNDYFVCDCLRCVLRNVSNSDSLQNDDFARLL